MLRVRSGEESVAASVSRRGCCPLGLWMGFLVGSCWLRARGVTGRGGLQEVEVRSAGGAERWSRYLCG